MFFEYDNAHARARAVAGTEGWRRKMGNRGGQNLGIPFFSQSDVRSDHAGPSMAPGSGSLS